MSHSAPRPPHPDDRLAIGYLAAMRRIVDAGYGPDVDWAEDLGRVEPNARHLMTEFAWVVVNSGFRASVAKKLWPGLSSAFHGFEPASVTEACLPGALQILNHPGKLGAIVAMGELIRRDGIDLVVSDARTDPTKLTRLPWIGKITCWHLAKVLGSDVVKPDVHLQRAANEAGCASALDLCERIRTRVDDRLTVIDTVLWRYGEQQKKQGWPGWGELFETEAAARRVHS